MLIIQTKDHEERNENIFDQCPIKCEKVFVERHPTTSVGACTSKLFKIYLLAIQLFLTAAEAFKYKFSSMTLQRYSSFALGTELYFKT